MGTTVRRQPVNFDIPKSPDYKFLNITNFRGLDVSSNPFELASNTASDCLNVYVDETNTLTTRPRLDKKMDAPLNGRHIATYNLHDGYLFHYANTIVDGEHPEGIETSQLWIYKDGSLLDTAVSGTIPTNKCSYFEEGNKIYLLDGSRYMVIENNMLEDVEGYIPTTSIVADDGTKQNVETLNILTGKYREKYYWDGLSKLPTDSPNIVSVENNYYKEYSFPEGFVPLRTYDDFSAFGYFTGDTNMSYITFEPDKESTRMLLDVSRSGDYIFATDAKVFWRVTGSYIVTRFALLNNELTRLDTVSMVTTPSLMCVSPDGLFAITSRRDTGSAPNHMELINAGANMSVTEITRPVNTGSLGTMALSNKHIYWYCFVADENTATVYTSEISSPSSFSVFDKFNYNAAMYIYTTATDSVLMLCSIRSYANDPVTIVTYLNRTAGTRTIKSVQLPASNPQLSPDGLVIGSGGWTGSKPIPFWYYPDANNLDEYLTWDIGNYYNTEGSTSGYFDWKYSMIHKNKYVALSTNYYFKTVSKYYVFTQSTEPLLDVIKRTEESEHKKELLSSKLTTRFDNNYWFASGNRYYRSQNNDPTYFPTTEYNDLGDSNEIITGFNLANDTTMIVYKTNKLYLVQPFTSSLDTREYTITESKNTVGNTAIGSPIVTTLTEVPLQINSDGIFGLSQLSNVSATERIADLMSEPINERWLKLDDSLVEKTMTLNRLYWTYVIIPDELDRCTMIYLLDNRTNSWYYWELPIMVSNAFVKDNITEFVDVTGVVYYLTTQDIVDKNYEDQIVTKYYDYGGKLIKWYWQSQILPLGTMNYAKRLVNTTFILTDTDDNDGYGLKYSFKVFRKLASSVPEKEITDKLTLVRSTTRKTNVSKFGFIQLRLDNLTEESRDYEAYENNKLRLVGLGLKYVLLEGLIR